MVFSDLTQLREDRILLDRNQMQLALAVADGTLLQSLLANCSPAIARPHQMGCLRVSIGLPPGLEQAGHPVPAIDAVVEYEHIWCLLSSGGPIPAAETIRDYQYLTRCQSDLKTLAWRVNLSDAIALLSHGGFQEDQIQRILQLPWDGWHRSWWDTLDAQGNLGLPFQRWFRTRCYSDGTYTLQYRDHYPQDAPPCFRGVWRRVPVMLSRSGEAFGAVVTDLRHACHALEADCSLLLADDLSDLEAEAYMRQGVSLYPLKQSLLAEQSLCTHCQRRHCPMNHRQHAPVVSCREYLHQTEAGR